MAFFGIGSTIIYSHPVAKTTVASVFVFKAAALRVVLPSATHAFTADLGFFHFALMMGRGLVTSLTVIGIIALILEPPAIGCPFAGALAVYELALHSLFARPGRGRPLANSAGIVRASRFVKTAANRIGLARIDAETGVAAIVGVAEFSRDANVIAVWFAMRAAPETLLALTVDAPAAARDEQIVIPGVGVAIIIALVTVILGNTATNILEIAKPTAARVRRHVAVKVSAIDI